MKTTRLILAALAFGAVLAAADAKNSEARVAPSSDLYTDELRSARELHGGWNTKDEELDEALHGGSLSNPEIYKSLRSQIAAVLKLKKEEMDAWTLYYQKTADYWQSTLKTIQSGQPGRASERQDLQNMLAIEKREREDIQRRLQDLMRTLSEKGVSTEQAAVQDLRKLLAMKEDNTAKLEQAIREFDLGSSHLDKRRELARARSLQTRQLLRSIEVERPLWDALYNGKVHRLDLDYDTAIPEAAVPPDDWKKKAGLRSKGDGQ